MRGLLRLAGLTVALLGSSASVVTAVHAAPGGQSELAAVRQVTAAYHDLSAAQADGFGLLRDAQGVACIDLPGVGGMGEHYVNLGRVLSGTIDATAPQALVYAPLPGGGRRLVAVEYVVFVSDWIAHHDAPPSLFGREFDLTRAGNRFGLPPFYSLHAWLWDPNPSGQLFAWNPRVSCS
jgi:hypothetical protein